MCASSAKKIYSNPASEINWAYLFQIAHEKSCDYILIIYMKKYKIAYHNYAEAKCVHQVQKKFIQTLQVK